MVAKNGLTVYLGDLTHYTMVLVSDTVPINIGGIATYTKQRFPNDVNLELFKFPDSLIQRMKESPPDVLALSNYSWNSRLSEHVAGLAKHYNPSVITVQGGTNFPHEQKQQLDFIKQRPNTDVFVELEGELSFSLLVERILEARDSGGTIWRSPIQGCVFIDPDTKESANPEAVYGSSPPRLKALDDIPSPYLNGTLDKFLDGILTPFLETNRGCPFRCSFCHTGNDYFNKINMFSMERVIAEIEYVAPRAAKNGIVNLHFADVNFGMFSRDREICEALKKANRDHGWPRQIMATTGKNNKERVIDVTKIMGDMFSVNMSVQSMDHQVLTNIQRDNIKLDHYTAVTKHLNENNRATKGELILGLPGETRESFVRGVKQVIDAGVSTLGVYTLMLLHGTPFQDPAYRKKFDIQGKFRLVPLNFGEYEGTRIFDYEEAGVSTKDMSFDDYLWSRGLSLIIETLHNNRPFASLFRYSEEINIKPTDLLLRLYESIDRAPRAAKELMQGFMEETVNELWESEEELVKFYRKDENYMKLLRGEVGGNLIYKYKGLSLAFTVSEWVEYVGQTLGSYVNEDRVETDNDKTTMLREIDTLIEFELKRLAGVLDADADTSPLFMKSDFDILCWLRDDDGRPLADFRAQEEISYQFAFTKLQMSERQDYFKRYGTSASALSKIVTRVSNVESLFRTVVVEGSDRQVKKSKKKIDSFTRYGISN